MTWFKENKFLSGLLGITLLLAILLIFFGMKSGTSLEAVQDEITDKQDNLKRMKGLNPYPTDASAKAKEDNLKAVLAKGNQVRDKLLSFRPENLSNPPGKIFSENLSATVEKIRGLFPNEDALPDRFNLGFESYTTRLPEENATGILTYQLAAMESVFEKMAEAGVTEVRNLHRVALGPESGKPWPNEAKPTNNRRRTSSSRSRKDGPRKAPVTFEKHPYIAHRLPFEVVFSGPEVAVREVLTCLGNSDEFFFDIRAARVVNPSLTPTAGKSASAAAEPKESAFGDFDLDDPDPSGDSSGSVTKVLEKVSGGDELLVYLRADLLLFLTDQKFPELK